jgi:hypothetical protein
MQDTKGNQGGQGCDETVAPSAASTSTSVPSGPAASTLHEPPKFTPGPWIWAYDFRGLYGAGPDNEVLSYASYENMWLAYGDKREANARLIAAAPSLYEALAECMDYLSCIPESSAGGDDAAITLTRKARAALALARA